MSDKLEFWKDEDIIRVIQQVHSSEHGLVIKLATPKDLDTFKRRVWDLIKRNGLEPLATRLNPTNPRTELFLLKIKKETGDGEEAGAGDSEIHLEID